MPKEEVANTKRLSVGRGVFVHERPAIITSNCHGDCRHNAYLWLNSLHGETIATYWYITTG